MSDFKGMKTVDLYNSQDCIHLSHIDSHVLIHHTLLTLQHQCSRNPYGYGKPTPRHLS
jgi:hypothetical protein